MLYLFPILFAVVACLYAMAGFGGGSTYIAMLAVSGLPLAGIPVVALTCNLVVTAQGSILLMRRGHAKRELLLPLLGASVPCAFIGGAWRLPESSFILILASALTVAGIALLVRSRAEPGGAVTPHAPRPAALMMAGAVLGLLAGVTGIGGGIYLAPVMHLRRWAEARTVAACTSVFIALNSASGLAGQLTKGSGLMAGLPLWLLLSCPVAVLVGGRLGSSLLAERIAPGQVRLVTAVLILLVSCRLWIKVASG